MQALPKHAEWLNSVLDAIRNSAADIQWEGVPKKLMRQEQPKGHHPMHEQYKKCMDNADVGQHYALYMLNRCLPAILMLSTDDRVELLAKLYQALHDIGVSDALRDLTHRLQGTLYGKDTTGVDVTCGATGSYTFFHKDLLPGKTVIWVLEGNKQVVELTGGPPEAVDKLVAKFATSVMTERTITEVCVAAKSKGVLYKRHKLLAGDAAELDGMNWHAAYNHKPTLAVNCTVLTVDRILPVLSGTCNKMLVDGAEFRAGPGVLELLSAFEMYLRRLCQTVHKRLRDVQSYDKAGSEATRVVISQVNAAHALVAQWITLLRAFRSGWAHEWAAVKDGYLKSAAALLCE
jgi:hypothetical protein